MASAPRPPGCTDCAGGADRNAHATLCRRSQCDTGRRAGPVGSPRRSAGRIVGHRLKPSDVQVPEMRSTSCVGVPTEAHRMSAPTVRGSLPRCALRFLPGCTQVCQHADHRVRQPALCNSCERFGGCVIGQDDIRAPARRRPCRRRPPGSRMINGGVPCGGRGTFNGPRTVKYRPAWLIGCTRSGSANMPLALSSAKPSSSQLSHSCLDHRDEFAGAIAICSTVSPASARLADQRQQSLGYEHVSEPGAAPVRQVIQRGENARDVVRLGEVHRPARCPARCAASRRSASPSVAADQIASSPAVRSVP